MSEEELKWELKQVERELEELKKEMIALSPLLPYVTQLKADAERSAALAYTAKLARTGLIMISGLVLAIVGFASEIKAAWKNLF